MRGIEAQKANIQSAKAVARILRSSLGPKGMDKMLQSGDGDVCISKQFSSFKTFLTVLRVLKRKLMLCSQ